MTASPRTPSLSSSPAALRRTAGIAGMVGTAGGPPVEALEPRLALSSFAYGDLSNLVQPPGPIALGDDYNGPVAVVGDVDADGYADVLVGRSGSYIGFETTGERRGAALFSGRTGQIIREHTGGTHFGWDVAALGDVTGDGVPDYGIAHGDPGSGAPNTIFIYSGATGALVDNLGSPTPGQTGGSLVAAIGDLDGDGRNEVLFSSGGRRVTVRSGGGGTMFSYSFGDVPGASVVGTAIAGGGDVNGDDIPDFFFTSLMGDPSAPTATRVYVASGATGNPLYTFDVPYVEGDARDLRAQMAPELNEDGAADLMLIRGGNRYGWEPDLDTGRHELLLYSGLDGTLLRTIADDRGGSFSDARFINDIDGDEVADLAVGVPALNPHRGPAGGFVGEGAIFIYSAVTGERLSVIADTWGATTVDSSGQPEQRMSLGVALAAGDIDGDGVTDLVSTTLWSPDLTGPGVARVLKFDGNFLVSQPTFGGTAVDHAGNLVAWGRLGQRAFIHYQGRTTFLSELDSFGPHDQVLAFSDYELAAGGHGVLVVAAPNGHQPSAFAWYADAQLQNPTVHQLALAARAGKDDAENYVFERIVSVSAGRIFSEMRLAGASSGWIFGQATPESTDPFIMRYAFDGTPVDIAFTGPLGGTTEWRMIGIPADAPQDAELVFSFGDEHVRIEDFTPVALGPGRSAVGVAQFAGEDEPVPYVAVLTAGSEPELLPMPLIAGGTDWMPVDLTDSGWIVGSYRTAGGRLSSFYGTPVSDSSEGSVVDLSSATVAGAPEGWSDAEIMAIAGASRAPGTWIDVYVTDPQSGASTAARLFLDSKEGYLPVPADADLAASRDGRVLVTRDALGNLVVHIRQDSGEWDHIDVSTRYADDSIRFDMPYFGDLATFGNRELPDIVIATAEGVIVLEVSTHLVTPPGSQTPVPVVAYSARNITLSIDGATAVADGLTLLTTLEGYVVIAGVNADGEMVAYTSKFTETISPNAWSYINLFDVAVRPLGLTEPAFDFERDGDPVGYVTAWNGVNIAAVSGGHVVTFWTPSGLDDWRYSNLTEAVLGQHPGFEDFKNLSVYLTPWGGINIVGNDRLQVYWWTPGLGGEWRFDVISSMVAGAPELRSQTMTSYTTPWGGLNIAGLDSQNRLWVYWWTPGTNQWTAQTIDEELSDQDRRIPRIGRLESRVSDDGAFSIFARTPFGDMIRYAWAADEPWRVELMNLRA